MSKKLFLGGEVQLFDNAGDPLAGGKVYFYEPGTSTAKDTYTDSTLATANANPVVLDAYGRASIWLSGDYKVVVKDSTDVTIYTEDNINPATSSTSAGEFSLIDNGSFEDDADADGTPDSWTLTTYTGSTCQRVTDDQNHGAAAMKFISVGNGGGYVESESFFEVSPDTDIHLEFDLKSSVADVRNVVDLLWYTAAQALISTTSGFDEAAANPTSWAHKSFTATPPATARYAKLRLYGCHSSDATPGTTWYDNVVVWAENTHTHPSADISDSTATGRSVLTAADAAAGRVAISALEDVITTRGDIIRGSSANVAERLALGVAGLFLKSDGTDAAWAGAPLELIASAAASGASQVDFTDLSTTYFAYLAFLQAIAPGNDTVTLHLRTSTDNGASFNAGVSDYESMRMYGWGPSNIAAAGGTGSAILLSEAGLGNAADEVGGYLVLILNPAHATSNTRAIHVGGHRNYSAVPAVSVGSGQRLNNEANDAIRFILSAGTITGNFRLYGARAS